jgi:hypothetical protein
MMAYVYGAIGAVMLVMGLTTWWALSARDEALQSLAAHEASASAVIAERISAEAAEKERNRRKTEEIVNGYKAKLARLTTSVAATAADRDAIAERLRDALAARSAPAVPGAPAAASDLDGTARRDALLAELAGCVTTAEQLRYLQDWIRSTH